MKKYLPSTKLFTTAEVEIHYTRSPSCEVLYIHSSRDADRILRTYINLHQLDLRESFWVMLLTNANQVIGISETARGTIREVSCNPRCIFQLALLSNASAIILAHNHPSGKLEISRSDMNVTKNIKDLATMMGMTLLDHMIITSETYVSIADEGKL